MFSNKNVTTYKIIEAPLEAIDFPTPLFLRSEFMYRTTQHKLISIQCRSVETNVLHAYIVFAIEGDVVFSLPASPFGSFYSRIDFSTQDAIYFVDEVKKLLKEKGCKCVEVKHYPACYGKSVHNVFLEAMLAKDFNITCQEINQHLTVNEQLFSEVLHDSARRRLKKCHDAGFQVLIEDKFNTEEWFDRIVRARKLKGHPVTTDLLSLNRINTIYPSLYHFVSVHDKEKTIASAIAIEVMPSVLYYYLPANEEAYLKYSPMIMLVEALYNFAQQKKMSILDLGTSSSDGIINEGLRNFKNNLGAQEEFKLVLKSSL